MPPQRKKKRLGRFIVIYGDSGVGKTSLAAHFPRPGFIIDSQEQGIHYLEEARSVPKPVFISELEEDANAWKHLLTELGYVQSQPIDTLVLESLTGLEGLSFLSHREHNFDGPKSSFYKFYRGPKEAAKFVWPELIGKLVKLAKSGKDVILTAHSRQKEIQSSLGEKHLAWRPYCEDDVWQRIHKAASDVWFIAQKTTIDPTSQGLKTVAKPDVSRQMYITGTAFCTAKNWHAKTGIINMGKNGKQAYDNVTGVMGV